MMAREDVEHGPGLGEKQKQVMYIEAVWDDAGGGGWRVMQIPHLRVLLYDALQTPDLPHKQWYLWRLAAALGYDLSGASEDKGIGPWDPGEPA